jgi:DNA-binding LacI/PurR family transcriptional regulator
MYSLPTLSTVNPGRTEIARTAVRLLVERIEGGQPEKPLEIEAPFRLLHRESTRVPSDGRYERRPPGSGSKIRS